MGELKWLLAAQFAIVPLFFGIGCWRAASTRSRSSRCCWS